LKKTNLSVNAQDRDGNTPLHIASQRFNYENFPILLSQPNIDVRIKNRVNQPALKVDLYAVNNKFIDGLVEKILWAPNVDVVENAIPSENGGTFVHQYLLIKAKNMGSPQPIPDSIWNILNSNINILDEAGQVPIMMLNKAYTEELYASKVKEVSKILDNLVQNPSIELDAVDKNGNNMFLHFLTTLRSKRSGDSIAMNIKEINTYLTMLASKGVNPTLPNNNGQTIVDLSEGLPNKIQEQIVGIIAKFVNK
jgi:ankyrin repeat protein